MSTRLFHFAGGTTGPWIVRSITATKGEGVAAVERLGVSQNEAPMGVAWVFSGTISNERYLGAEEKTQLLAKQEGLGRVSSTYAALIPIKKNEAWWAMTQDARKAVFEEQSRHTQVGLDYLPAIARRLHHCRDLGAAQPFDFLTWFEFSPQDEPAFDDLVSELRATPEWSFVDREVDIRLERKAPSLTG